MAIIRYKNTKLPGNMLILMVYFSYHKKKKIRGKRSIFTSFTNRYPKSYLNGVFSLNI